MRIQHFYTGPLEVNCYLVSDETKKAFIVDPGGYNASLTDAVKELGLSVEYIILTHGHGDHMGGVEQYRQDYPQAQLVASSLEKELLANSALNLSLDTTGRRIELTADRYVNDGDTLKIGNMELTFLSTPGHTPGGMCILLGNCVFSGDTLFAQSIGRTDFPGGDYQALVRSVREKLYPLPDDTQVLPGHMGTTTIGFEKEHNPFV